MIANTKTNAAGKGRRARSEDLKLSVARMMLEHRTDEVRAPCRYLGEHLLGKRTASAKVLRWKEAWCWR